LKSISNGIPSAMIKSRAAKGAKREAILNAAIRVFARRGFHQSPVSEIAREAGVADGTIYLYFKNKDDLLIAIFEDKMAEVIDGLREALGKHETPSAKLNCFINFHLGRMAKNRELAEILQVELRLSSKFMKEYVPVRLTEYLDIIASVIEEGQAKGEFRADLNPGVLKWAVFGALDELAMHWVLSRRRRTDLKMEAAQVSELLLRGMRNHPERGDEILGEGRSPEGAGAS